MRETKNGNRILSTIYILGLLGFFGPWKINAPPFLEVPSAAVTPEALAGCTRTRLRNNYEYAIAAAPYVQVRERACDIRTIALTRLRATHERTNAAVQYARVLQRGCALYSFTQQTIAQ